MTSGKEKVDSSIADCVRNDELALSCEVVEVCCRRSDRKSGGPSRERFRASRAAALQRELGDDDFLFGVVEGDAAAGLDGSNGHAQSHGMGVAGFDIGVGSFSAAHAFHPISHVG